MNFCGNCDTLLILKYDNANKISHYCEVCDKYFNIKSLLLKSKKNIIKEKYTSSVLSALYDDTLPRKKIQCENCKNGILVWFRDEKNMRCIYICRKCKSYFNRNN